MNTSNGVFVFLAVVLVLFFGMLIFTANPNILGSYFANETKESKPASIAAETETSKDPTKSEEKIIEEAKRYDGAFKFSGEAVVSIEDSNIIFDPSVIGDVERGNYTDIIVQENMTDFNGNVFSPGIYEFQFVEFPEEQGRGAWYVYINETRVSGNPNASDAGKEYEIKVGDIVSVEFWTIATFYKVAE